MFSCLIAAIISTKYRAQIYHAHDVMSNYVGWVNAKRKRPAHKWGRFENHIAAAGIYGFAVGAVFGLAEA
jgi:hypothetical protein